MTLAAACSIGATFRSRSRSTGKERDTESGNDYFGARYYASSMGRFMSPDWASDPTAVPYASYANPQSLNLYGYMRNNPLAGTDPDGHCCESDFDSFQTPEQANYFHQPADDMDRQFYGGLGKFTMGAILTGAAGAAAPAIGAFAETASGALDALKLAVATIGGWPRSRS
jgi:RHS repeat-associated protein